MSNKPRVIVLGIDGATWDYILPLVRKGKLPTLGNLINKSAWGNLKSTIPPRTFPAWQSMFTGLNPGKLGVYEFIRVDTENKKFILNSPESFKNNHFSVWKILNKFGFKCAVINLPTAKVEEINGYMVGGPFSLAGDFFPSDLTEIFKECKYEMHPKHLSKVQLDNREERDNLSDIEIEKNAKETIDSRFNIARYLLEKKSVDFLIFVLFIIDSIQHFFWDKEILSNLWEYIDIQLNHLINEQHNNDYFILCSDHGFTKIDLNFYIWKYLTLEGYLKQKIGFKQRIINKIDARSLSNILHKLRLIEPLRKIVGEKTLSNIGNNLIDKKAGNVGLKYREELIDWNNSDIVPFTDALYLTHKNRHEKIIIKEITQKLNLLKYKNQRIIKNVYLKSDIYKGEYVDLAPDLFIVPEKNISVKSTVFVDDVVKEISEASGWNGDHADNGIFLINGPRIKPGIIEPNIYDVAPTILKIFGIPRPKNVDGKVIESLR